VFVFAENLAKDVAHFLKSTTPGAAATKRPPSGVNSSTALSPMTGHRTTTPDRNYPLPVFCASIRMNYVRAAAAAALSQLADSRPVARAAVSAAIQHAHASIYQPATRTYSARPRRLAPSIDEIMQRNEARKVVDSVRSTVLMTDRSALPAHSPVNHRTPNVSLLTFTPPPTGLPYSV